MATKKNSTKSKKTTKKTASKKKAARNGGGGNGANGNGSHANPNYNTNIDPDSVFDATGLRTRKLRAEVWKHLGVTIPTDDHVKAWEAAAYLTLGKIAKSKKNAEHIAAMTFIEKRKAADMALLIARHHNDLVDYYDQSAPTGTKKEWGSTGQPTCRSEFAELLANHTDCVPMAWLGRFVADRPDAQILSAIHRSHLIAVNPQAAQSDPFTTVDDLTDPSQEIGAGMLSETEFNAGLYYGYATFSVDQAMRNAGDINVVRAGLVGFIRAMATVLPGARQATMHTQARPCMILAEIIDPGLRNDTRSYSEAFSAPVKPIEGWLSRGAIHRVLKYAKNLDDCIGTRVRADGTTPIERMVVTDQGDAHIAGLPDDVKAGVDHVAEVDDIIERVDNAVQAYFRANPELQAAHNGNGSNGNNGTNDSEAMLAHALQRGMRIHIAILLPLGMHCLNRDDTGMPKQITIGGLTYGRISSQCWWYALRHSAPVYQAVREYVGTGAGGPNTGGAV